MKMEELKGLSIKQILAIIGFWNNAPDKETNKMFANFTEFVGAIQKGYPYHENSPMRVLLKTDDPSVLSLEKCFPHAFYDMTEGEEAVLFNLLKEKFADAKRKNEPIW